MLTIKTYTCSVCGAKMGPVANYLAGGTSLCGVCFRAAVLSLPRTQRQQEGA